MAKRSNILTGMVLGVISLGIVLGSGYYRSSLASEGVSFQLTLHQNKQVGKQDVMNPTAGTGKTNVSANSGEHKTGGGSTGNGKMTGSSEGKDKPVKVDIAAAGFPKRLLQPWVIRISSKGIENKDDKAHTLQFELTENSIPVEWSVRDAAWDEQNHVLARPLQPGKKTSLTLVFKVPQELRNKLVIYDGKLKVVDYQTKEELASVPIKITNSDVKNAAGEKCEECGS